MIITSAAWIGFFVNGRYGCLPLVFIRFVNDKSFLAEYERRLDKVVEHDLKKKYHVGRKLGEGVTSQVYRIQERSSSSRRRLLTSAGISIASAGFAGGVCVIGRTRTIGAPSSVVMTIASTRQGRSLSPSSRPSRCCQSHK